jgi:sugar lactone lactonase YvrE
MKVRCVLDAQAGLAEGPHWWAEKGVLLWVDIEASRVGFFDPVPAAIDFWMCPPMWGPWFPPRRATCRGDGQGFVRLRSDSGVVTPAVRP